VWFKWQSTYLASARPQVQASVPPKEKKIEKEKECSSIKEHLLFF
jgi:hypothetical protein